MPNLVGSRSATRYRQVSFLYFCSIMCMVRVRRRRQARRGVWVWVRDGSAAATAEAGRNKAVVSGLLGSLQAELGRMTARKILDAKTLAASRKHGEAERRRRQRINGSCVYTQGCNEDVSHRRQ